MLLNLRMNVCAVALIVLVCWLDEKWNEPSPADGGH